MDDRRSPSQTLAGWFKSLVWIYFAAYGIGLLVSRATESFLGYPQLGPDSLLELRNVVFGLTMVLLGLVVHAFSLAYLHTFVISESTAKSRPNPVLQWVAFVSMDFVVLFLAARLLVGHSPSTWPELRLALFLAGFQIAVTAGAVTGYRRRGTATRKRDSILLGLGWAGIGENDAPNFVAAVSVVLTALLVAITAYPKASPSFGGGAGVPVRLLFAEPTTQQDEVQLLRRDGEFLLIAPLDSIGCPTKEVAGIRMQSIRAFRSLPDTCGRLRAET